MSLRCETPCDYGECPYDAMYNCDCEYWCGADEPQDEPEIWEDEDEEMESGILELKTYPFERDGEIINLFFEKNTYTCNGRLALSVSNADDGEIYTDVTKNIVDLPISNGNCAFLNCNDEPWLEKWLSDLGVAKPTGHVAGRMYQEYEFDAEFLKNCCIDWGN